MFSILKIYLNYFRNITGSNKSSSIKRKDLCAELAPAKLETIKIFRFETIYGISGSTKFRKITSEKNTNWRDLQSKI